MDRICMSVAILPMAKEFGWPASVQVHPLSLPYSVIYAQTLNALPVPHISLLMHQPCTHLTDNHCFSAMLDYQQSSHCGNIVAPQRVDLKLSRKCSCSHHLQPSHTVLPQVTFHCSCMHVQGLVQSGFLWGYMATQMIGGSLADKYGGETQPNNLLTAHSVVSSTAHTWKHVPTNDTSPVLLPSSGEY